MWINWLYFSLGPSTCQSAWAYSVWWMSWAKYMPKLHFFFFFFEFFGWDLITSSEAVYEQGWAAYRWASKGVLWWCMYVCSCQYASAMAFFSPFLKWVSLIFLVLLCWLDDCSFLIIGYSNLLISWDGSMVDFPYMPLNHQFVRVYIYIYI